MTTIAYIIELWAAPAALTINVSNSKNSKLSYHILTSHFNLLWHNKGDCVVDIKGRLIRYAENCVIADEFDLKKVLNLKINYKISYFFIRDLTWLSEDNMEVVFFICDPRHIP